MKLTGAVTLITGASTGIGAACAAEFRSRGATVALAGRDESRLRATAVGGEFTMAGDLCDSGYRKGLVDAVTARFGRIDILINNAGVGLYAPATTCDIDEARSMFELNFFAPLELTRLVAPGMRERRGGMIVNVSSIAGQLTLPWFTVYSATKSALAALSDGVRMELEGTGVRTTTVYPGYVKTGFQDHVMGGRPPRRIRDAKQFAITPQACAKAIARGVERDARTVTAPQSGTMLVMFSRLFPALTEKWLAGMNRDLELES
jgi:short-subunit dehydrogenase